MVYLVPQPFHILVISLFIMVPKHHAEMLSGAPNCKKTVMCLIEKRCVFSMVCSGTIYSAVGFESMLVNKIYMK